MEMKQLPSEHPHDYGPLELHKLEGRDEVAEAFTTILNSDTICISTHPKRRARDELVLAVARLLLGSDWDCERLC